MVKKTRALVGALLACTIIVFLAGCAAGGDQNIDGLSAKDVVGVWTAARYHSKATLNVYPNGTFTASDWPLNLGCQGTGDTTNDILWHTIVDSPGTWMLTPAHSDAGAYILAFNFSAKGCSGGLGPFVLRASDGSLVMEIDLWSVTDPDNAVEDQIVKLRRVSNSAPPMSPSPLASPAPSR